jgi:hypothetical protein
MFTRVGLTFHCKSNQNIVIALRVPLFYFACDKIFEMRIKNLLNILDKINLPLYALTNKNTLVWLVRPNRLRANWSSYSNGDLIKTKFSTVVILTPT